MNVQLRKGGAVHFGGFDTDSMTPACNPWGGDAKYRVVKLEVTCKKCSTYMATHAERIAAEAAATTGN